MVLATLIEIIAVCGCLVQRGDLSGDQKISKWDPLMSRARTVTLTNGVAWIDGRCLPVEGRAYEDVDDWYDRLPSNVTTNVNEGVRSLKHHTSGMVFRFVTDSKKLKFRWRPRDRELSMDHMPATSRSGIDVYRFDEKKERWLYVGTGRIWNADEGGSLDVDWKPGAPCLVNLPLYNGICSFSLGIDVTASVSALPPRKSGIAKPVVFYGTSITQGGCCSRPGLAYVNWIGRDFDVPVVGLGFSGSGVMEFEMSEHLARIDASCYVLDCLWNMALTEAERPGRSVQGNYERFIRNLRTKRPNVPIVMAEAGDVYFGEGKNSPRLEAMAVFIRDIYGRLKSEGWERLYYVASEDMFDGDFEGTVDGIHPNDLGMRSMKDAYGRIIAEALGLHDSGRRVALSFGKND